MIQDIWLPSLCLAMDGRSDSDIIRLLNDKPQYIILIARQRPQYMHATIEEALQEVFSMWVHAMPIAM
jgi:hypothetical protein